MERRGNLSRKQLVEVSFHNRQVLLALVDELDLEVVQKSVLMRGELKVEVQTQHGHL